MLDWNLEDAPMPRREAERPRRWRRYSSTTNGDETAKTCVACGATTTSPGPSRWQWRPAPVTHADRRVTEARCPRCRTSSRWARTTSRWAGPCY